MFLPPHGLIKKVEGILRVAPVRPAIAISENSWLFAKGKPRLSIWTVMILQYNHTAKPHKRLGIEIHRFRLAIDLPSDSQNFSSSGFQVVRFGPDTIFSPIKVFKNNRFNPSYLKFCIKIWDRSKSELINYLPESVYLSSLWKEFRDF